jgi:hypothetical protein
MILSSFQTVDFNNPENYFHGDSSHCFEHFSIASALRELFEVLMKEICFPEEKGSVVVLFLRAGNFLVIVVHVSHSRSF